LLFQKLKAPPFAPIAIVLVPASVQNLTKALKASLSISFLIGLTVSFMVYTSISKLDCAKFCNDTILKLPIYEGAIAILPQAVLVLVTGSTSPSQVATTPPLF
jgi:hypothetical protein